MIKKLRTSKFKGFPRKEEWHFADISDNELLVCCWWEYLREIPEVISSINSLRFAFTYGGHPTEEQWENSGLDPDISTLAYRAPFSFIEEHEWPNVPFSSLSPERRKWIARDRTFVDHAWEMTYDVTGFGYEVSCLVGDLVANYGFEDARKVLRDSKWFPAEKGVFPIKVRWEHSDEYLIQCFAKWLRANRPKDKQVKETRGSGSEIRQLRARLKELGAYRLLKTLSWEAAYEYTQEVARKALISDYPHTWKRASEAARRRIRSIQYRLHVTPWLPIDEYVIRKEMFM